MTEGSYDTKQDWLSTIENNGDFKWVVGRKENFVNNEKELRRHQ